jgi:primosomal protein N' (replication factor Y)
LVTLVGVVSADVGLNLPDFRAGERVFQTLAQVAGRAGRGVLGGRVILQTYQPEHQAIISASKHDYNGFAERELTVRRQLGYPPFRRIVRVLITHSNPEQAKQLAQEAGRLLRSQLEANALTGTEVMGAVPCFYARIDRVYRWQVLIRGGQPERVLDGLTVPAHWSIDVDPTDVL